MKTTMNLKLASEITKTVNKKRVPVGTITVHVPDLAQLASMLNANDLSAPRTNDEGLPEYGNEVLDWLMRTVRSACQVNARNKLVPGTVELKPGNIIPTTLEDLCAPSAAGGNGEAFKQLAELRSAFNTYVDSLGKQAKTASLIKAAFKDTKAFSLQPVEVQSKLVPYFEEFAEATGVENLTSIQVAHIEKLLNAEDSADDDFDDL